jgi:hypothetical protein
MSDTVFCTYLTNPRTLCDYRENRDILGLIMKQNNIKDSKGLKDLLMNNGKAFRQKNYNFYTNQTTCKLNPN